MSIFLQIKIRYQRSFGQSLYVLASKYGIVFYKALTTRKNPETLSIRLLIAYFYLQENTHIIQEQLPVNEHVTNC